jgi:hypothetical protein
MQSQKLTFTQEIINCTICRNTKILPQKELLKTLSKCITEALTNQHDQKVVDVESPLPPAIVDEESESNGLTSNPLLAMDSLGAPPSKFQPALSDSARPLPKANRPIVELVGLRSGNARGNPEMRGNRAVGELLKVHPSDEWYPVRLIISGKRIKV